MPFRTPPHTTFEFRNIMNEQIENQLRLQSSDNNQPLADVSVTTCIGAIYVIYVDF